MRYREALAIYSHCNSRGFPFCDVTTGLIDINDVIDGAVIYVIGIVFNDAMNDSSLMTSTVAVLRPYLS